MGDGLDKIAEFLKELTEAPGLPGYERPATDVVRRFLASVGDISYDKLGSLICRVEGSKTEPRVLIDGHVDEIGFMVKHISDDGFIRFAPLGGWYDGVLLAQRVKVRTCKGEIIGVIGAKPPHLLTAQEREKPISKDDMFIDIGASSKREAERWGVRLGDPIIPDSSFTQMRNPKLYLSKAWDDRVGTGVMACALSKLAKIPHANTVYGVAAVQEEMGLRGATTSVAAVNPHVAIALETGIANDLPGARSDGRFAELGKGPVIRIYEPLLIPNLALRDHALAVAEKAKIKVQPIVYTMGGTDGRVIAIHNTGVPTIVISTPTRYIHSHNAIINRSDFDKTVDLVVALAKSFDAKTVASFTQ
jgi:putative aminopeptidase FrvX